MRLTNRDYDILEYVNINKGITLNQASKIFFSGSYKMASKRMNVLVNNNYIKSAYQPNINKKVYYLEKVPSYHMILANGIILLHNRNNIHFSQREFSIGKSIVDFIVIDKSRKVFIYEIDIYHRTTNEKIEYIFKECNDLNMEFIIIGRNNTRYKKLDSRVRYAHMQEICI